jgi:hypothetical protein
LKFIKYKIFLIAIGITLLGITSLIIYNFKYKVTEESIISNFNENYEYFSDVEKYINENKVESLYAHKDGNKIIISINDQDECNGNLPIKQQIEYLINKLDYERIDFKVNKLKIDKKDVITFERTSKGGYEQGIVFIENNNGEYGMRMTKIRDEWYYYAIGYV